MAGQAAGWFRGGGKQRGAVTLALLGQAEQTEGGYVLSG